MEEVCLSPLEWKKHEFQLIPTERLPGSRKSDLVGW